MNYTGIDYHKRYSVACTLDAQGRKLHEAKIEHNAPAAFAAYALATLLRGDFVAKVHVPSKDARSRKNLVRQRLWLARVRTMIRNRIHTVIDRHPQIDVSVNPGAS